MASCMSWLLVLDGPSKKIKMFNWNISKFSGNTIDAKLKHKTVQLNNNTPCPHKFMWNGTSNSHKTKTLDG
jgi:hypothetical protein